MIYDVDVSITSPNIRDEVLQSNNQSLIEVPRESSHDPDDDDDDDDDDGDDDGDEEEEEEDDDDDDDDLQMKLWFYVIVICLSVFRRVLIN